MDVDSETVLPRPCKTCHLGVLSVYDPVRFKNCARCRAQNRASPREAKQKSAKKLQNYEVNAKQAAARMALGDSGERGSSENRKKALKRRPRVREFPTTTEMYDVLSEKVLDSFFKIGEFLEFHGTVYNLVEAIDFEDRVFLISIELADCARLRFDEERQLDTEIGDSSYSIIYPCWCQSPLGSCHGKVKVTAETTEVFSGGVARQKTTVRVYHA